MNIKATEASVRSAADLMRSLSNENRLMMLCQLVEEERSVGWLAEELGLRQTVVSQHLALLRRDGLVQTRRDAQTIYYSLASTDAARVIELLHELFCEPRATAAVETATTSPNERVAP